jgi:hypothetical protein
MKQKILELLKERGKINITDFHTFIPELKGEYAMYMPVKQGLNPNILWIANVNQEFIKAFNELLIDEKIIKWEPADIWCYMYDGSPIYTNMKLCEKKHIKKSVECWLPIVITTT